MWCPFTEEINLKLALRKGKVGLTRREGKHIPMGNFKDMNENCTYCIRKKSSLSRVEGLLGRSKCKTGFIRESRDDLEFEFDPSYNMEMLVISQERE